MLALLECGCLQFACDIRHVRVGGVFKCQRRPGKYYGRAHLHGYRKGTRGSTEKSTIIVLCVCCKNK